jgi:hypothetical protein
MPDTKLKRVLFHRSNAAWTGGNIVHAQYFRLISELAGYEAQLYLAPAIENSEATPWAAFSSQVTRHWTPENADILFLAGLDWESMPPTEGLEERIPVINLIQGFRHTDPSEACYQFLNRKALRVCVSPEVELALRQTGMCNGPIVTIPNAVSLPFGPVAANLRSFDIAIAVSKQPLMAQQLAAALRQQSLAVDLIEQTDRISFLKRISDAKIAIVLPKQREGFHLPALEAMALGCLVICPDCIGNRSFCIDGETCLIPHDYNAQALVECVKRALQLTEHQQEKMIKAGIHMAENHNEAALQNDILLHLKKTI